MKKSLLATFGVAASIAAGAGAAQATTGYIDISYTHDDISNANDVHDLALGGAVSGGLGGILKFEVDGKGGAIQGKFGSPAQNRDAGAYDATVHVYHQNDGWLLGGFIMGSHVNDINIVPTGSGLTEMALGAEGRVYLDNLTLGASVLYGEVHDLSLNNWNADVTAHWFLSDSFRLDGRLMVGSFDQSGASQETWGGGVGAEMGIAGPVSAFAEWEYTRTDDSNRTTNAVTAGVRYNFGPSDLKKRDRSGAGLGAARGFMHTLVGF